MQENKTKKLISAISYLPFLWLLGLLLPEYKNDSNVRFHVGQGMVLTIFGALTSIVVAVVKVVLGILFLILPFGVWLANLIGDILGYVFLAIEVFMIIKGVLSVVNETQEPLPILGKFTFYK